jgi:hypothetical protein
MVIYIKDNWVIETNTEGLNIKANKQFVVYNPILEKVLFESDDMNECIKHAEKL